MKKTTSAAARPAPMRDLTFKLSTTSRDAFDKVKASKGLSPDVETFADKIAEWPSFVRETFGRIYRPGDTARALPEASIERWAAAATSALETQAKWPELRTYGRGSRVLAAEAAEDLARRVGDALGLSRLPGDDDDDAAAGDPAAYRAHCKALAKLAEATKEADAGAASAIADDARAAGNEWKEAMARRKVVAGDMAKLDESGAMAKIVGEVATKIGEKAKALKALRGLYSAAGVDAGSSELQDGEVDDELVRMLQKGGLLERVLQLLGKINEESSRVYAAQIGSGRLDVVGVELGGDPLKLVGGELAMLGHGVARLDVMRRLTEKGALQREQLGEKIAGDGEFFLLADRSSSMAGEGIVMMRAISLVMLLAAVKQRRRVILVMFDHTARPGVVVERGGKGLTSAIRELMLAPNGGTSVVEATLEARKHLTARGRARVDTVVVTDGEWEDPTEEQRAALRRCGGQAHEIRITGDVGDVERARARHPWMDSVTAVPPGSAALASSVTRTLTRTL